MTHPPPTPQQLLAQYQPGFSLPADFYSSPAVYEKDLEAVFFRHWLYAGHVSEIPEAGCYFLVEVGGESIIVVRGKGDGDGIRAFANVCRHRGARICRAAAGKVGAFVCPYHAWTYGLDGQLRTRRAMPDGFDPARYGLKSVRCEVFHGLIFINLNTETKTPSLALADGLAPMDACYKIYQLENTKVACRRTYPVAANWKLAVENFMECYHCAPAHAEYASRHTLQSPDDNEALRPAMLAEAAQLGYHTDTVNSPPAAWPINASVEQNAVQYYYMRNAMYAPFVTGGEEEGPLAPLLGKVGNYGGGAADVQIGPVFYSLLYPDHAVLYRFTPRAVQATDMDIFWLVNAAAEEGRDYDVEKLTWLWRVTSEADKQIIMDNQKGVNSRFYEPGPLSTMEEFSADFIRWYLGQIS